MLKFLGFSPLECMRFLTSFLCVQQKEEFLSFSGDAYVPEDLLEEHLREDILLRKGLSVYGSQILGNRLQLVEVFIMPSKVGVAACRCRKLHLSWFFM